MNSMIEKFNHWIRQHKLFAISAPIIVLLTVFFITTSISSVRNHGKNDLDKDGYNNFLPDQKKELKVDEPNDIYKNAQQDSLDAQKNNGLFKSILHSKKENDSLERLLEELNNFSLDETASQDIDDENTLDQNTTTPEYVTKKSVAKEKLEYRKLLMEARDERLSRSQDYSAPYMESPSTVTVESIKFDASIYRDQFILPGNRVVLILREDVHYNNKRFPKNTFVYAKSNLQGSRVLLEVTNIDNVKIPLTAIDQEDGMVGLHNERAGELLNEFNAEIRQQGVNELSEAAGEVSETPLGRNLVRSFGNFFQKKKYKQQDKILLVNGDRVFLVPKT